MGQFFSWVKSNEKQILVILDNLAKKAVEVSEAVVVMLSDLDNVEHHKKIHALETEADSLVREIFSELTVHSSRIWIVRTCKGLRQK